MMEGVSNWSYERFAALRALAESRGMPPPAASSPQFSLPQWVAKPYPGGVSIGGTAGAGALRAYRAAGAAVLAWSPLGNGWLRAPGRHARGPALRELAVRRGMPPPAASSPQFSLPQWVAKPYPGGVSIGGTAGAGALRAYRAAGAAVLAWSPLGNGWLRAPGRHARGPAYRGAANDARHRRLTELAEGIGCTPAQAALAYVLAHGSNVHAVVGTRRPERLAELQAATALTLSPEQVAWLADGRGRNAPASDSKAAP